MLEKIISVVICLLLYSSQILLIYWRDYVEYNKPLERIRRDRIAVFTSKKLHLENRKYNILHNVYTTQKKRERAQKALNRVNTKIKELEEKLMYLENYGEKEKPTQEVDLK